MSKERNSCYIPVGFTDREDRNGIVTGGDWRQLVQGDSGLRSSSRLGSNNYTRNAAQIQETMVQFFISLGKVSWQGAVTSRGLDPD